MPFTNVLSPEQRRALVVDYEDGFKLVELRDRYGVSLSTVYRILARAGAPKSYNSRKKRKTRPNRPVKLMPCGTNAGYRRHKRKEEYPCCECLEAHALDQQNRRKKKASLEENANEGN